MSVRAGQARELFTSSTGASPRPAHRQTEPSGTISDAAFENMRDGLISRLKEAMPVDVVALEVHGAGVAESYEDIEGNLAQVN